MLCAVGGIAELVPARCCQLSNQAGSGDTWSVGEDNVSQGTENPFGLRDLKEG